MRIKLTRKTVSMTDLTPVTRFVLTSSAYFGLIVWGAGTVLFSPRSRICRAFLSGLAFLCAGTTVALLEPTYLPAFVGWAGIVALVMTIGWERIGNAGAILVRPFRNTRVGGTTIALAAVGGLVYEGWRHDQALYVESDQTLLGVSTPPNAVEVGIGRTDRGTAIPLQRPTDPIDSATAAEHEKQASAIHDRLGQMIRRSPADDGSNCHGWIFTGGRYIVGGHSVDTILNENGYVPNCEPAVGDLCVYRNEQGAVSHTAVIRAVFTDGTVLVEGKWGRMGVYLHAVGDSCYGQNFTYYHSSRATHLLASLDEYNSTSRSEPSHSP
jgi:hypothetical protein